LARRHQTDLPNPNGPHTWREQSGRHAITFEEAASNPPHPFTARIADKNLPFSGSWTWEIIPTDTGCICRITEEGEIPNPLFRLMAGLRGQYTSIDDYLNAMGRRFNENVSIEHQ
jgi:hypothetical protein